MNMRDYFSLTQRCKETSLNIFARKPLNEEGLSYFPLFKEVNIYSYNENIIKDSLIDHIVDRIFNYNDSQYAFYTIFPVEGLSNSLILYMMKWITIYDAVFLIKDREKTVIDFGLFANKFFNRSKRYNYWQNSYIKYITIYEIENIIHDMSKFNYFSESV